MATEHRLVLVYYTATDYDTAVCVFDHCFEFHMGMPGEDQMQRHPLRPSGVRAFGAYRIEDSPWIAELEERYNVISEFSRGERHYQHYLFAFHDRCFECVAAGLAVSELKDKRTIDDVIHDLPDILLSR
jgi:hypothetical protein